MEMKLSVDQNDIEQAIRDFVASKGITTPVKSINFVVSRKGGFALTADVEVSETPSESVAATPQTETKDTTPDAQPAPKAESVKAEPAGPVKDTGKTPATKPAVKAEKPDPTPEPEPAKEEDETPFTPDAKEPSANDEEAPAKAAEPKGKSLFG